MKSRKKNNQSPDYEFDEIKRIEEVYKTRDKNNDSRYSVLNPVVIKILQEKERALIRWIKYEGFANVSQIKLLEIGSGYGDNLLEFIKLGFSPANLVGNDIITKRIELAKNKLPSTLKLIEGDAATLNLPENTFDVVFQSTVFSSILDNGLKLKLSDKMWKLAKPGGGLLWYDFIYNNPKNKDVKGIPVKTLRSYFPSGKLKIWKITLAPPVARLVTKLNPNFYNLFNLLPILRTHVLCWIKKPLVE